MIRSGFQKETTEGSAIEIKDEGRSGVRINHNIAALNSYRHWTANLSQVSRSVQRLSSGWRISTAADDAASLSVSVKMRAQIGCLKQASRNAQNGITLLQAADDALGETHAILQRMRELAVRAADGTLATTDRAEIQGEITRLTSEIDHLAATTVFNGKSLLSGGVASDGATDAEKTTSRVTVETTRAGSAKPTSMVTTLVPGHAAVPTAPFLDIQVNNDTDWTTFWSKRRVRLNDVQISLNQLASLPAGSPEAQIAAALQGDINSKYNGKNYGGVTFTVTAFSDAIRIQSSEKGSGATLSFAGTDTGANSIGGPQRPEPAAFTSTRR